jgi:hypothetical protein
MPGGIGLFTAAHPHAGDGHLDMKTALVPLAQKPAKDFYAGTTFNLGQVIWLTNVAWEALIINLRRDRCDGFLLNQDGLVPLTGMTGAHLRGMSLKGPAAVLDDIRCHMERDMQVISKVDYVVVFHSAAFSDSILDFSQRMASLAGRTRPVMVSKNVQRPGVIEPEAISDIRAFQKADKMQSLLFSRQRGSCYVEGWKKVCDASRTGNVEILYIKPDAAKQGYLKEKDHAYTHPVNGSRRVDNIAPRILHGTLRTGGRVMNLKERDFRDMASISALVRDAHGETSGAEALQG